VATVDAAAAAAAPVVDEGRLGSRLEAKLEWPVEKLEWADDGTTSP
jgi:hypothetical protein